MSWCLCWRSNLWVINIISVFCFIHLSSSDSISAYFYDRVFQEASPRISETDLQISRKRISTFLSSHSVYELLPESGKVCIRGSYELASSWVHIEFISSTQGYKYVVTIANTAGCCLGCYFTSEASIPYTIWTCEFSLHCPPILSSWTNSISVSLLSVHMHVSEAFM